MPASFRARSNVILPLSRSLFKTGRAERLCSSTFWAASSYMARAACFKSSSSRFTSISPNSAASWSDFWLSACTAKYSSFRAESSICPATFRASFSALEMICSSLSSSSSKSSSFSFCSLSRRFSFVKFKFNWWSSSYFSFIFPNSR